MSAVVGAMPGAWEFAGDTPVATIDFASTSPILTKKQTAGEPQWLRVWSRDSGSGDPLNLMRVMPPKGARVRCRTGDVSHARDRAWFLFYDVIPNAMRDLPEAHLLIHDCAQRLD